MTVVASISISDRTSEVIGNAANRSRRIGQIVDRYGMLVARAQRELLDTLESEELAALKDAFSGLETKGISAVELIEASIDHATANAMKTLNTSWLNKIRAMDDLHKIAIVDWIEQQHI